MLSTLLKFALAIDWVAEKLSQAAAWAVLLAALISAGNALSRYGLNLSSNAWLEVQWYLFAGTVMLGAPFVLKHNEHVRVDIFYSKLTRQAPVWVDVLGLLLFLLPAMAILTWLSWPLFWNMFQSGERSLNAGGLVRWPVVLLLPLGFGCMFVQGLSELIKRVAYLKGQYAMDTHYDRPEQ